MLGLGRLVQMSTGIMAAYNISAQPNGTERNVAKDTAYPCYTL